MAKPLNLPFVGMSDKVTFCHAGYLAGEVIRLDKLSFFKLTFHKLTTQARSPLRPEARTYRLGPRMEAPRSRWPVSSADRSSPLWPLSGKRVLHCSGASMPEFVTSTRITTKTWRPSTLIVPATALSRSCSRTVSLAERHATTHSFTRRALPVEEIVSLLIQRRAFLEYEVRFLLGSEQIRDPAPYNAILTAIAGGQTKCSMAFNK